MVQAGGRRIKRPILFSVLLTALMLLFPVASGTLAAVLELGSQEGKMVQSAAFLLAALIGLGLARRYFGSLPAVGLRKPAAVPARAFLWFAPLLLIEALPFLNGLKEGLTQGAIALSLVFTLLVGFTEELYFRGLVWQALRRKSLATALFLSSFLFSIGHFFNLMAGAGLSDTVLQVIFAFVFGVVAAEIAHATGSLLIPAAWHFAHNFISQLTRAGEGPQGLAIALIQGTVLSVYAIYLYRKVYRDGR